MRKEKLHVLQKITLTVLATVAAILLVAEPVFSWFSKLFRYSRTEETEISMPPVIYLKDDNLKEMTSFRLDGLKIGVEYNFVFCVSPAVDSINQFFLGLIFTENMGMDINIYPVFEVTVGSAAAGAEFKQSDITEGDVTTTCYYNFYKSNDNVFENPVLNGYTHKTTYGDWENVNKPAPGDESLNNGIYKAYDGLKFSDEKASSTELVDRLNDTSRFRFFVLNITWPEWAENTGTENVKEADVVYIISKGTSGQTQGNE